ncbi:MAG: ABC transporter permease [Candidatus Marinimicrobia bacterium]|nr:ABC transporter permease [Candidatus Neomarinimicrobiota bacterium]
MGNLFFFAFRLVFSKEKGSFSSFASVIAIIGLGIGVASLLITVSVVQGFHNVISEKLSSFEGEGRIKHILSKNFRTDDIQIKKLSNELDIDFVVPYVRNIVLARKGKKAEGIIIEGLNELPKILTEVHPNSLLNDEIIIGHVLAKNLEVKKMDKIFVQPLQKKNNLNFGTPIKSLIVKDVFTSGLQEFDKTLAYTNLETAQKIFEIDVAEISGLIITNKLTNRSKKNIDYPFIYETWKSRHSLLFQWIELQRWPAFIMFGLITLVGVINLLSSINMIIQEKKGQISILLAQGIRYNELKIIFMYQGGLIGFIGAFIGGFFSFLIINLDKYFNIFKIPSDVYFMDRIPFSFDVYIFSILMIIIFFISFIFSWVPVKHLENINLSTALKFE